MSSGRKIIVEFLGNDKSLSSAANKAESRMSGFGSKLKAIGKTAALGFAAAGVVAGKALFDMTKAAAEDQAGQVKLAQALKNTSGATDDQVKATEDWITAQGKALGVADDDLRPALAKLAAATHDVGEAQRLASLGMDVAAGSGKSLEAVSKALANAANGNVAGLAKLGISTKDAAGETISFEEAQKRLAATFKGQAEKQANTLQGKLGRLKLALSEMGETIGAKLIPVVTKMADWFVNKALPSLEKFGGWLSDVLPPIFGKVQDVIGKFTGGGGAGGKLSKFVDDMKSIFQDGITIVTRLWDMFGKNIVGFLTAWVKSIVKILSGVFQVIKGIFQVFAGILSGDWAKVWDGLKNIFEGFVKVLVGLVENVWATIKFAFKNAGVVLKAIFGKLWDGLRALAKKGVGWLIDQFKAIPSRLRSLLGLYVSAYKWVFGKMWDGIKALARTGADWLVDQIRKIPGRLLGLGKAFLGAGKGLIGKLLDGLGKVGSFVGGFATDIWNAVAGAINAGIDKLNDLLEFDFKVKGIGFTVNAPDIPNLPTYAKGTRNHPGGFALVGENGPEILDLPRGSRVTPNAQSMGTLRQLGGSDDVAIVQFYLDGKLLEQSLIRRSRDTQRPIQVKTL